MLLRGGDGFSLLENMVANSFHTIVVSGNVDRAVEAFAYGVLDFISKPIREERLKIAIDRMLQKNIASGNFARYLSVKKEEKAILISLEDVLYFQGCDNNVDIFTIKGKERHRKTLESLSLLLPPHFVRIHKSFIVNMEKVSGIETSGGGRYYALIDKEKLPISRTRYKELKGCK